MSDLIITQDPTKPGVDKLNGPALVNGKIPLNGLDTTGAIANDVVTFTGGVWTHAAQASSPTASNLGAGTGVFSAKVGNDFQFKSLIAGSNITLTPTATDITIAATTSGILTAAYVSPNQTITYSGALTLAHGLASMPTLIQLRIKCTTAENGYSIGDEVMIAVGSNDTGSAIGISVVPDATNLNIRFGSQLQVNNKGTGAANAVTAANWVIIFRAWK